MARREELIVLEEPAPEECYLIPFDKNNEHHRFITEHIEDDKTIIFVHLPKDPIFVMENESEPNENTLFSLKTTVEFEDGSKKSLSLPFDDCFKLAHKEIWENPDYRQNPDEACITMETKLTAAAPYNLFFNTLKYCSESMDSEDCISFEDLLCPSLGELEATLHITHVADIWWILTKYSSRNLHNLPMTIIDSTYDLPWPSKSIMNKLFPNIDHHVIWYYPNAFKAHHSRLSIFMYKDQSMRIVVGSSNLRGWNWDLSSQQIWVSPKCPQLERNVIVAKYGDSSTGFKQDLLRFFGSFKNDNIRCLSIWIDRVKTRDFSDVKVALVYNTRGFQQPGQNGCAVYYLGTLLSKRCVLPAPIQEQDDWPVVALTASLGFIGKTPDEWLRVHLLKALSSHVARPYQPLRYYYCKTKFHLIYPSMQNCCDGYLGAYSGKGVRYERDVQVSQPWVKQHQCQWKADKLNRTGALPTCRCYCRLSPNSDRMAFYFLTSANLSRSGWGSLPNKWNAIPLRQNELGILFLPTNFGEECFEIADSPNRRNEKLFPIPFDVPLTPYQDTDQPYYCLEEMLEKLNLEDAPKQK